VPPRPTDGGGRAARGLLPAHRGAGGPGARQRAPRRRAGPARPCVHVRHPAGARRRRRVPVRAGRACCGCGVCHGPQAARPSCPASCCAACRSTAVRALRRCVRFPRTAPAAACWGAAQARAPAPAVWCSRPDSSLAAEAARRAALVQREFARRSALLRPAIVRQQLFFPDRRLLQYDCGKLQARAPPRARPRRAAVRACARLLQGRTRSAMRGGAHGCATRRLEALLEHRERLCSVHASPLSAAPSDAQRLQAPA